MKQSKLPIYQLQEIESEDLIFVPSNILVKQWGLKSAQAIDIKSGTCICTAQARLSDASNERIIKVSKRVLKQLSIPADQSVRVHFDKSLNQISIGPIIGLYAIKVQNSASKPFGEITGFLQELQLAGLNKGAVVYVFCPQKLEAGAKTLVGYSYRFKIRRWVKRRFPIPDVVYDRVLSRKMERKSDVKSTRKFLTQLPGLHYFNRGYLDKWEVYKHLVKDYSLRPLIPETRLCTDITDVVHMLDRYHQVYIKPANSSHGLGICWVSKGRGGYYGHFINWHGEERAWYVKNTSELAALISRITRRRKYIVQQGLKLAYKNKKPTDIRVLMQKNSEGLWRFTTFIARVAADGSRVSNFEHGGSLTSVYRLLKNSSKANKISYRMQRAFLITFAKNVCKQLENSMQVDFAELGLDMALDVQGRLWLIEVNSRPARDLSDHQRLPQNARLSVRRVIDYAGWLSGFTAKPGGE